jgi:hypothetical protein
MNYKYKRPLINILRSFVFFAIWLSILFASQGRLYYDALGFFLAFTVAFSDKIYRFLRRTPR